MAMLELAQEPAIRGPRPIWRQGHKRIAELIGVLDDDRFADHEKATKELGTLGATALPDLLRTLESQRPPKVRRRIEQRAEDQTSVPTLRKIRAMKVLEHIESPAALRTLRDFLERDPDMPYRREACETLQRLTRHP